MSGRIVDVTPLPGLRETYGLLAAILQDGTKEWRGELDPNLPDEAVTWQAHPGGHSIGGVILEMIDVEIGWFEGYVLGRESDPEERKLLMAGQIDVDSWKWPTPHAKPLSWYFDLHDRIRQRTLEGLKEWPEPDSFIEKGNAKRSPRWVLGHVIQHEAYHGGQAVLLSRQWELSQS